MAEGLHDIVINGSGETNGGRFRKVVIRGDGSIHGKIECAAFINRGTSTAYHAVQAGKIKITGQSLFRGDVSAERMGVVGQTTFERAVTVGRMNVTGEADIRGHLKGEAVKIRGKVLVAGDVEAESFTAIGGLSVAGMLNAGTVDIGLRRYVGTSEAKEVGCENLRVRAKKWLFVPDVAKPALTVELIEADVIDIEATRAKVVRGNRVRIGAGCDIDLVEYKQELEIHPRAAVKEKRKI